MADGRQTGRSRMAKITSEAGSSSCSVAETPNFVGQLSKSSRLNPSRACLIGMLRREKIHKNEQKLCKKAGRLKSEIVTHYSRLATSA